MHGKRRAKQQPSSSTALASQGAVQQKPQRFSDLAGPSGADDWKLKAKPVVKLYRSNTNVRGQKFEVSFWWWEIPNSAGRSYRQWMLVVQRALIHIIIRWGKVFSFSNGFWTVQQFVKTFSMVFVTPPKIYCGEKTHEKNGNSKIGLITYTFRAQIIISQQRN